MASSANDNVVPGKNLPRYRRFHYWLGFLAIYTVHVGLCCYALPVRAVFGDRPFAAPDYQTHYGQVTVQRRVLKETGHLWAYDPSMLAGHPTGLMFDVDNKAHSLFTIALTHVGVKQAAAFNLFTALSCLLAPLSLWFAARLFGLGRRAELLALGAGMCLWHFDSGARVWTGGMISFATVAHLSVPLIALYYRMLKEERNLYLIPLSVLLSVSLLIHVWTFAILVVPLVGLYVIRARRLRWQSHARVLGLALVALTANLFWLYPALKHAAMITTSGTVGQATPLYVLTDWFEILVNPITTGFAMPRTLFRFTCVIGLGLALHGMRKSQDERCFVLALTAGWLFGMGYCAALFPVLRETEPYRFVMPGFFLAGVVASSWFAENIRWRALRALPKTAQALLLLLLLLLIPRLVQQVIYFIPELSPEARLPPIVVARTRAAPTTTLPGEVEDPPFIPRTFRLRGVDDITMQLGAFVRDECKDEGRVLVQHWAFAEFLRWASHKPIIGGFPDRRMIHEQANMFRRPTDPRFHDQEFADYLERYNIRYVVITDAVPIIERRRDVLEPLRLIGMHRIYRTVHPSSYLVGGTGKVVADINRIEVSGAHTLTGRPELMLKFHHMDTLSCRPACTIQRADLPYDRAGFIRVVGTRVLPEHFVIEHHY